MVQRYRKFVLQIYRRLRHPRHLKQSRLNRWLGRHFVDKAVWRPSRHTIAGGLAIGMFVNAILAPGQMPIAAGLAAMFRVNIPIAIAVCWISNPVTIPAMAWWEIVLGNWIMQTLGLGDPPPLSWTELKLALTSAEGVMDFLNSMKPWAASLYVGGAVAGAVLAVLSFVLTYLCWDLVLMLVHRRRKTPPEAVE